MNKIEASAHAYVGAATEPNTRKDARLRIKAGHLHMLQLRLMALLLIACLPGTATESPRDPGRDAFLAWAKSSLKPIATVRPGSPVEDLRPLGDGIGNASLVALSEAVHAGAEPLDLRNRLIEYLIQEKGFTAVAIESGLVEGRKVHDYLLGGSGDLQQVLAEGISWTFDRLTQNRDLGKLCAGDCVRGM